MPQHPTLSVDQKIQIARIAADLMMHHCPELTSSNKVATFSSQLETCRRFTQAGDLSKSHLYSDIGIYEHTFDWFFKSVMKHVTDESVSLE